VIAATSAHGAGAAGDSDPPSITVTDANTLIMTWGVVDRGDQVSTPPAGYNEEVDDVGFNDNAGGQGALATKTESGVGAKDPGAYDWTTNDEWAAITYAYQD